MTIQNEKATTETIGGVLTLKSRLTWLATASTMVLAAAMAAPVAAQEAEPAADVTEVVVTATRRATSVQKVPYNISVIGASDLSTRGITELSELSRAVPGLSVRDAGSRDNASIILRGLSVDPLRASNAGDNGSVAIYINDTPVINQPKIFDIERVEILRGPQGTLYGSGSLGGAIRYIVADPKMKFEASAGGKVYQINEADDVSYEINGMINMPLVENKLAMRVAAQYLDDSGFTDYPFVITGPKSDLDYEERITARASLLWTPTEDFEATLSYYMDNSKSGGRTGGNPGFTLTAANSFPDLSKAKLGSVLGDYEIGQRFEEPQSSVYKLTALELKYNFGFADIISSTSYTKRTSLGRRDQTDLLLGLGYGYETYPDFRAITREIDDFEAVVQELRLVSTGDGPVDYVAGIYYDNETSYGTSEEFTPGYAEFIGAARTDELEYYSRGKNIYAEWAVFGEATWHITDNWQVTGGARSFKLTDKRSECTLFPLFSDPDTNGYTCNEDVGKAEVKDTIYKLNTSFQWTPDVMVYGTFSQGFRRGGTNILPPEGGQVFNIDPSQREYAPDTVDNYEIGVRSQWFDRKLTVNAAVFNIKWQDVQLASLAPGNLPITANAGQAQSKGIELETLWKATEDLTLSFGYAYTNAKISEDFTPVNDGDTPNDPSDDSFRSEFYKGTPLPGTPEQQMALAADYDLPFRDWGAMTLHGDISYSSEITTSAEPVKNGSANLDYRVLKGFTQTNLSLGWAPKDNLGIKFYVDNVFDEYAYVAAQGEATYGLQGKFGIPIRPRVIGVSISKKY